MRISQEGRSWSKVGAHAESDTGANAMLTEGSASLPFGKQRPTGNPLSRSFTVVVVQPHCPRRHPSSR